MTVVEYANALGASIVIRLRCRASAGSQWYAQFDKCCTCTEGGGLIGNYGNGVTPDEALKDYVKEICGKRIIFNAMDEHHKREYEVPVALEV